MRIIRHPVKEKLHRPVVALGTFDGVHIGHQKIIRSAVEFARKIDAHSAAITFDPHPQEVIAPERGLKLLTTLSEREELFCRLGIEAVVVVGFTRKMRELSCPEFVKRYLVGRLGVRWVFVGYDYACGKGRRGNVSLLRKMGKKFGFGVTVVPQVKAGKHPAKSARIREYLGQGQFRSALQLLGHPYRITGKVVSGNGRGKTLGFPTANLKPDQDKLIPAQGVYVGFMEGLDSRKGYASERRGKCVVNIGSRPTFGSGPSLVEVHILNFNRNIRGKTIAVDLFYRLRGEKQFSDVDKLRAQIKKDIVRAREM